MGLPAQHQSTKASKDQSTKEFYNHNSLYQSLLVFPSLNCPSLLSFLPGVLFLIASPCYTLPEEVHPLPQSHSSPYLVPFRDAVHQYILEVNTNGFHRHFQLCSSRSAVEANGDVNVKKGDNYLHPALWRKAKPLKGKLNTRPFPKHLHPTSK